MASAGSTNNRGDRSLKIEFEVDFEQEEDGRWIAAIKLRRSISYPESLPTAQPAKRLN
jgi:hypothetical protein